MVHEVTANTPEVTVGLDLGSVEDAGHVVRTATKIVLATYPSRWCWRPSDLANACGSASHALVAYLRRLGVSDAEVVVGENDVGYHAWVEWDGWRVDLTATQFGAFPPVLVNLAHGPHLGYEESARGRDAVVFLNRHCGSCCMPKVSTPVILRHAQFVEAASATLIELHARPRG